MELYRCAKCKYILDLSGEGAFRFGGRWNSKGVRMLYAASNPALALLETLVHTVTYVPGMDFCMLRMETQVDSIQTTAIKDLPADWSVAPSPDHLKRIGDEFIKEGKFLMLKVPSAVLPIENNYLINPAHPMFSRLKVYPQIKISIDQRLMGWEVDGLGG